MLRGALWIYVGVFLWGSALSSNRCPDGTTCSDRATCCQTTDGYSCCHYPNAVCCADLAHCCPSGFICNATTQMCVRQNQPWMNIPILKNQATERPRSPDVSPTPFQEGKNDDVNEQAMSSVVHCDNAYVCPDGTTCCHHPKGGWFCCPYSPGKCCLDGYHCCPYGYDCDHTYTHCIREGLRYPFTYKHALPSLAANHIPVSEDQSSIKETPLTALTPALGPSFEQAVIRCDDKFYCPDNTSCCQGPEGQWNCCPFPLGTCCADGKHCCEYGYQCDSSSSKCTKKGPA